LEIISVGGKQFSFWASALIFFSFINHQNQNLVLFFKLINLTDQYLTGLQKNKQLSTDIFINIAKAIPREQRNSFDNLALVLLEMLKKGKFSSYTV
jgi:hypothetical protein